MHDLNLAVVGNCQVAALIDSIGSICWFCWPRLDGDPIFCSLLRDSNPDKESGFFDVQLTGFDRAEQRYEPNTGIVETVLYDKAGGAVRLVDFAPRFRMFDRMFRPAMLVRRIEPVSGSPHIRVRLRPNFNYGAEDATRTHGSHHVRYVSDNGSFRVTTDLAVTSLLEETPFVLEEPVTIVLGPDETVSEAPSVVGRSFYENTRTYWREWARGLSIPFEWQDAVIRAAITLKMCIFEDTGAVLAALTSSIPEAPDSGRNWDYRFCWLRDSYYVVHALNGLGATQTMESFLHYIVNIVASAGGNHFQPVYGISGRSRLDEREAPALNGYRGMGPVRIGNQAYLQRQNDVYGAVILSATQMFFDKRLTKTGDRALFERLEELGEHAVSVFDKPDAGIWEFRGRECVHTYSSVMCWAACDRLSRVAESLGLTDRKRHWRQTADRIHEHIMEKAWSVSNQTLTASFGGSALDASLLVLPELRFITPGDARFRSTLDAIEKNLMRGKYLFRYSDADDFGAPETAFTICTFWYINALAAVGREREARELFEELLACRTPLGLLSEDIHPATQELWGNFPQTYSMVGIINAATRLSKSWDEAV